MMTQTPALFEREFHFSFILQRAFPLPSSQIYVYVLFLRTFRILIIYIRLSLNRIILREGRKPIKGIALIKMILYPFFIFLFLVVFVVHSVHLIISILTMLLCSAP